MAVSLFRRRAYEPVREPRVPGLPEERGVRPAAREAPARDRTGPDMPPRPPVSRRAALQVPRDTGVMSGPLDPASDPCGAPPIGQRGDAP